MSKLFVKKYTFRVVLYAPLKHKKVCFCAFFYAASQKAELLVAHNHNRKPLSALSLIFLSMTKYEIVSQQVEQRCYLVINYAKQLSIFFKITFFRNISP